jgi:hypothetical protein
MMWRPLGADRLYAKHYSTAQDTEPLRAKIAVELVLFDHI